MDSVLVTGASGELGSALVRRLAANGHQVRALVHTRDVVVPATVALIRGDIVTGHGLSDAAAGVDVIIHAATSPRRRARETELAGARNVRDAATRERAHLIYPSIVGIDRVGGTYYRAKKEAEKIIVEAPEWTIQRATQFHPTLDGILAKGLFPTTAHLSFQPVDAGEVADELVAIAEAGSRGRMVDFGGPAALSLRELVAIRAAITGHRTMLPRVPAIGPFAALDRGENLCPGHARGTISWEQWLKAKYAGVQPG